MTKKIYVNLSKPIQIKEFDLFKRPMGWIRIESVLKDKKHLLSKDEIKLIKQNPKRRNKNERKKRNNK